MNQYTGLGLGEIFLKGIFNECIIMNGLKVKILQSSQSVTNIGKLVICRDMFSIRKCREN